MICPKCGKRLYVKDVRHDTELGETYRLYACKNCSFTTFTSEFEVDADDRFIADWRKLDRHSKRMKNLKGEN